MNPVSRSRLPIVLFAVLLAVTVTVLIRVQRKPALERLDPATVRPGETVAVSGRYLGSEGRLTLDGLGIPDDSIRSWNANLVVFAIPEGRSSGNVVIQTATGASDPLFLTVETDVPRVEAGSVASATIDPGLDGASAYSAFPGRVLVIKGAGFGPPVGISGIVFRALTVERRVAPGDPLLSYWSDTEIRVAVPDGAAWATVAVEPHGFRSAQVPLDWRSFDVRHEFGEPERFAVTFVASVAPSVGEARVLFPRPPVEPAQSEVQTLRPSDHAWERGYPVGWIATVASRRGEDESEDGMDLLERSELVTRRSLRMYADPEVLPDADTLADADFRRAFAAFLGDSPSVTLADRRVSRLVSENGIAELPAPAARLVAVRDAVVAELAPPEGEAYLRSYAYASLVVAVARRVGMPARRVAGMIALDTGVGRRHFWAEAFVPGIGWAPVDAAVAGGMYAEEFSSTDRFYEDTEPLFALDGSRVAFDTDGPPVPDSYPGVEEIVPAVAFTIRSQRVEHPTGEPVAVEWSPPQYLGRY